MSLVITRSVTTAYVLDVPCSRLCGFLLYYVSRRSRHKLLREESILAIATLRDYDGTFRLLCIRRAARYVYAQLSCLDRFMLHHWLCRAWGTGSTLDPSSRQVPDLAGKLAVKVAESLSAGGVGCRGRVRPTEFAVAAALKSCTR